MPPTFQQELEQIIAEISLQKLPSSAVGWAKVKPSICDCVSMMPFMLEDGPCSLTLVL